MRHEHKNGWNPDAFKERYSDVLDRYDFIVGDWGYNQLRLKGFFREGSSKSTRDSAFSAIQDYLHEYCNFGCAFFVLERTYGKSGLNMNETDVSAMNQVPEYIEEELQPSPDVSAPTPSAKNGKPVYLWRENQSPQKQANRQQVASDATNETEQRMESGKPTTVANQNGRKFNKGQSNHNHHPRSPR